MRTAEKDLKTLNDTYAYCPVKVSKKRYIEVAKLFFEFIMMKVLNGHTVTLPARVGELEVIGRKIKPKIVDGKITGLSPDWVKTKKLWETNPEAKEKKTLLYHFNEHSNGFRYKFNWNKFILNVPFKTLYTFIPTRDYKRSVWKAIMEGKEFRLLKN